MTTTIEAMKQLQQIIAAVFRDPQNITRDHLEVMKRLVGEAIAAEEAQKVEITEKFKALSENRKEIITGPCGQCKSSKVPCGCQITERVESYDGIGGTGQDTSRNVDGISKTNLRPISPANTEFLTIKLELMTAERDKLLLELGDLRALRAARPAPPADHIGDATKLVGEREALITQHRARAESAKLRGPNYSPCISADELLELLDMLAADAQSSNQRYSDGYAAGLFYASKQVAQQVAVPQDSALLDHLQQSGSTVEILPGGNSGASWSFRIGGLHAAVHHDIRAAIGLAMLAAAPQPPKAAALAADHAEDVRAMVPMTPEQISDAYQKATGQHLRPCDKHAVESMTREIEAHHEIGVKP